MIWQLRKLTVSTCPGSHVTVFVTFFLVSCLYLVKLFFLSSLLIGLTIAIILMASVVTTITGLSTSAIATNGFVRGGETAALNHPQSNTGRFTCLSQQHYYILLSRWGVLSYLQEPGARVWRLHRSHLRLRQCRGSRHVCCGLRRDGRRDAQREENSASNLLHLFLTVHDSADLYIQSVVSAYLALILGLFLLALLGCCLQDVDALMTDELNDIRIVGTLTIILLLGISVAGMEWEAKVWTNPTQMTHTQHC